MEYALQSAVYSALSATGYTIYDDVPQDVATFPYVTIGDDVVTDWSTDTASGGSALVIVHTWSRYNGRAEIKQMQRAVYGALHRATLTVTGFEFIGCEFDQSETILDPDGHTRHGIQTFRIIIDEAGYGE